MATGTINKPVVLSSATMKFASMTVDSNYIYIKKGKIIFSSYRNPILCCYATQNGAVSAFLIFTGQQAGDWTLSVTNIVGAATPTATIDGDDIKISGITPNWGQGYAIGL